MKIVFCHTDFRLYWPARLEALHEHLHSQGFSLTVVEIAGLGSPYASFEQSPDSRSYAYECLFPDARMEDIKPAHAVAALRRALDRLAPDVLFAGALAFPAGAGALSWAISEDCPLVIFDNAQLRNVPRGRIVTSVKRRLYSLVDAVLIPAPSHLPSYRYWGIAERRIFFGINAIDNGFFADARGNEGDEGCTRLPRLPDRFLLGVGRQIEAKNWSRLLDAWLRCVDSNKQGDLHLVLVGDGPCREQLERQSALHPNSRVIFRPFANRSVLVQYYAAATAFVLPSVNETWGLVVNEAMASGLPVMVSSSCGCAETLVSKDNGWVFDPESTDELAAAIAACANTPASQLEEMGQNSCRVVGDWGLPRFCSGVSQAVQTALADRNPRSSVIGKLIARLWKGRYRPV
jgi:glycosyltransferase involved in cell wall biosynthesis